MCRGGEPKRGVGLPEERLEEKLPPTNLPDPYTWKTSTESIGMVLLIVRDIIENIRPLTTMTFKQVEALFRTQSTAIQMVYLHRALNS